MQIVRYVCPTKFIYARRRLAKTTAPRILDIGCGNNSPTITKHWFPTCHYSGADIQRYNLTDADLAAIDIFYPIGIDGSGYSEIPDSSYDLIILHHVIEHMLNPEVILAVLCSKLKPGGYMWIGFPSVRSLSMPSAAEGTLQFCDDDTHIHVPGVREVSNTLLAHELKVLHAGRTRDFARILVGIAVLPCALLRKMVTGKLSVYGLWYVLGFEDHVFGQRKLL
jgi:SAM-dependent methyltransferase